MSTRPQSRHGGGVRAGCRVTRGTVFPAVCVKCGRADGLAPRRRQFSYVSPTIYIAFTFGCIGMILGAAFYLATRRTMAFTVPTCSACGAAWARASRRSPIFFAAALVATVVASAAWKVDADRLWLPIVGLLATVLGTMAVHAKGRKHQLWAKSIDETTATLMGIHPAVVAALEASGDGSTAEVPR
jgi:hypothetical protein